jgi:hypothetical protein
MAADVMADPRPGAGLGASHQTGWTGLVADVIGRRHRAYPKASEVIQRLVSAEET